MAGSWTRRPHVLTLVAALVLLLVGVGLLIAPWDGAVGAVAWVVIIGAGMLGALALFFARTPRS
jgi:hypothetical protein